MGHVDTGIEQQVDQGLAARPPQPVALTIQLDLDVCDVCHEPMVRDRPEKLAHAAR
jgi:hypothetical protein